MKKRHQIVMLPTEKAVDGGLIRMDLGNLIVADRKMHGNMIFDVGVSSSVYAGAYQPQHLHILSDDKIYAGDYFVTDIRDRKEQNGGEPMYELRKCTFVENGWIWTSEDKDFDYFNPDWSKKVVASTDLTLGVLGISSNFVEFYSRAKGIKEVDLVYTITFNEEFPDNMETKINSVEGEVIAMFAYGEQKVFSRKEVKELLYKLVGLVETRLDDEYMELIRKFVDREAFNK